jgi:hypothetical protein
MPQAKHAHSTLTILDAIAPDRRRFGVIHNPTPVPAHSATMRALDRAAEELAAKGPLFPDVPKEPPLPGVTVWGKITDQRVYTTAVLAKMAARKGGAL